MPISHLHSKEAKEKAALTRRVRAIAINVTKIPNRRRRAGEVANLRDSVRWFCKECNGYESGVESSLAEEIKKCPAPECPLWRWRTGTLNLKEK
jgi:hypothetical protein